jgi:hypothetical protein
MFGRIEGTWKRLLVTALSRSLQTAQTMNGELSPSCTDSSLKLGAVCVTKALPTAVLPVDESFLIRASVLSSVPMDTVLAMTLEEFPPFVPAGIVYWQ